MENNDKANKKEGQKFDSGKLPMFTVLFRQFPNAIKEVVRCSQSGHNKYPNDTDWQNFRRVSLKENPDRYLNASMRHLEQSGGKLKSDPDMAQYGGALHLAQSIWNLLAHLERKLQENIITDENSETKKADRVTVIVENLKLGNNDKNNITDCFAKYTTSATNDKYGNNKQ